MSRKNKKTQGIHTVYKSSVFTKIVVIPHFLIFGSMLLASVGSAIAPLSIPLEARLPGLAMASFIGLILWPIYHHIYIDRLIMTPEGIEIYRMFHHGMIPWENMSHFGWEKGQWIIFLNRDIHLSKGYPIRFVNSDDAYISKFSLSEFRITPKKRWIIFGEVDIYHFQKTELGSAIHYYAPHLFEYDAEKAKGKLHG
jgi:hypothetical protein